MEFAEYIEHDDAMFGIFEEWCEERDEMEDFYSDDEDEDYYDSQMKPLHGRQFRYGGESESDYKKRMQYYADNEDDSDDDYLYSIDPESLPDNVSVQKLIQLAKDSAMRTIELKNALAGKISPESLGGILANSESNMDIARTLGHYPPRFSNSIPDQGVADFVLVTSDVQHTDFYITFDAPCDVKHLLNPRKPAQVLQLSSNKDGQLSGSALYHALNAIVQKFYHDPTNQVSICFAASISPKVQKIFTSSNMYWIAKQPKKGPKIKPEGKGAKALAPLPISHLVFGSVCPEKYKTASLKFLGVVNGREHNFVCQLGKFAMYQPGTLEPMRGTKTKIPIADVLDTSQPLILQLHEPIEKDGTSLYGMIQSDTSNNLFLVCPLHLFPKEIASKMFTTTSLQTFMPTVYYNDNVPIASFNIANPNRDSSEDRSYELRGTRVYHNLETQEGQCGGYAFQERGGKYHLVGMHTGHEQSAAGTLKNVVSLISSISNPTLPILRTNEREIAPLGLSPSERIFKKVQAPLDVLGHPTGHCITVPSKVTQSFVDSSYEYDPDFANFCETLGYMNLVSMEAFGSGKYFSKVPADMNDYPQMVGNIKAFFRDTSLIYQPPLMYAFAQRELSRLAKYPEKFYRSIDDISQQMSENGLFAKSGYSGLLNPVSNRTQRFFDPVNMEQLRQALIEIETNPEYPVDPFKIVPKDELRDGNKVLRGQNGTRLIFGSGNLLSFVSMHLTDSTLWSEISPHSGIRYVPLPNHPDSVLEFVEEISRLEDPVALYMDGSKCEKNEFKFLYDLFFHLCVRMAGHKTFEEFYEADKTQALLLLYWYRCTTDPEFKTVHGTTFYRMVNSTIFNPSGQNLTTTFNSVFWTTVHLSTIYLMLKPKGLFKDLGSFLDLVDRYIILKVAGDDTALVVERWLSVHLEPIEYSKTVLSMGSGVEFSGSGWSEWFDDFDFLGMRCDQHIRLGQKATNFYVRADSMSSGLLYPPKNGKETALISYTILSYHNKPFFELLLKYQEHCGFTSSLNIVRSMYAGYLRPEHEIIKPQSLEGRIISGRLKEEGFENPFDKVRDQFDKEILFTSVSQLENYFRERSISSDYLVSVEHNHILGHLIRVDSKMPPKKHAPKSSKAKSGKNQAAKATAQAAKATQEAARAVETTAKKLPKPRRSRKPNPKREYVREKIKGSSGPAMLNTTRAFLYSRCLPDSALLSGKIPSTRIPGTSEALGALVIGTTLDLTLQTERTYWVINYPGSDLLAENSANSNPSGNACFSVSQGCVLGLMAWTANREVVPKMDWTNFHKTSSSEGFLDVEAQWYPIIASEGTVLGNHILSVYNGNLGGPITANDYIKKQHQYGIVSAIHRVITPISTFGFNTLVRAYKIPCGTQSPLNSTPEPDSTTTVKSAITRAELQKAVLNGQFHQDNLTPEHAGFVTRFCGNTTREEIHTLFPINNLSRSNPQGQSAQFEVIKNMLHRKWNALPSESRPSFNDYLLSEGFDPEFGDSPVASALSPSIFPPVDEAFTIYSFEFMNVNATTASVQDVPVSIQCKAMINCTVDADLSIPAITVTPDVSGMANALAINNTTPIIAFSPNSFSWGDLWSGMKSVGSSIWNNVIKPVGQAVLVDAAGAILLGKQKPATAPQSSTVVETSDNGDEYIRVESEASGVVDGDLDIAGNDKKFNEMVGRGPQIAASTLRRSMFARMRLNPINYNAPVPNLPPDFFDNPPPEALSPHPRRRG